MKRCAVFSCLGLGDGLISLILSNNLQLNGCAVTTFHPFLDSSGLVPPSDPSAAFPLQKILKMLCKSLSNFSSSMKNLLGCREVLKHCEKHYPKQTVVLNPIATPNRDYPYWANGRFDGNRPFVDNLYNFCKDLLKLPVLTKGNGIVVPDHVEPRRFENRVIIHPTSSRPGKKLVAGKVSRTCR